MTTIVYRSGVLCGDTLVTQNGNRVGQMEKIWKTRKGVLAGAAGLSAAVVAFREWTEGGMSGDFKGGDEKEFEGIVVEPDGSVSTIECSSTRLAPLAAAFVALGSGGQIAIGAMAVGAPAIAAARAAVAHDVHSGGQILAVKLDSLLKEEEEAKKKAEAEKAKGAGKIDDAAKKVVDEQLKKAKGRAKLKAVPPAEKPATPPSNDDTPPA